MNPKRETFSPCHYLLLSLVIFLTVVVCVCLGSVNVPFGITIRIIVGSITGSMPEGTGTWQSIILTVRLPRVLCVAITGAALSVCGGAMQGLLKNPLADGSTLGVSSGAALGAAVAIAFEITLPTLPFSGAMVMAMLFAFLSLVLILTLAYRLDNSLSTNTIILIGIVYSMFVSSILSLVLTFASDKVKNITFWTMGSLVSCLIGVCVSVGGSIGFVGLVTPHIVRMITGPNHKKLLPASMFAGAVFLMLADLTARMLLRPLELPIGVVTSFVGAILFVYIFYRTRTVNR